jgi:hypothetical protein
MRERLVRQLLGGSIAIGLVTVVELTLGWTTVLTPWLQVSPVEFILPTIMVLGSYLLRSARLMDWFSPIPAGAAIKIMLQHNLWNNLLPMRIGELSFPILLQRHLQIAPGQSLVALAWFRILDLTCLILILASTYAWLHGVPILILCFIIVALAFLPVAHYLLTGILPKIATRLPALLTEKLNPLVSAMQLELSKLWRCLAWTFANWALKLVAFGYVFMMFAEVNLQTGIISAIGGELTSILPIHGFAGAGTYEAGVVGLSLTTALDAETALAAGVNLHLFLLSLTLLTGIGSQLLPPYLNDKVNPE